MSLNRMVYTNAGRDEEERKGLPMYRKGRRDW
jgi:hypothetical protein